ncbi:unnamed protein product [Rotaria sp. Silwood2]|nr:unnamed protein product [Rotaria sp. Silwood2]CAF2729514.1 unnamed protein product [Rotaria sp. Silwood2]CAF4373673.1 unnamed protein product [Rotaria sp. Silwood2]CAF4495570.1 unnamed protein product [Rotaria sp. Silwood2]
MNNIHSRLEMLPNETFIEIFQYLDIENLFRAFDNLNFRFNTILRNLNNLVCYLWDNNYTKMNSFISYIDTLIINCRININFNYFTNIRYLKLTWLTDQILEQLNTSTLRCLEHLFVKQLSCNCADILYDKIFSNTFPCLKSFYVCQNSSIIAKEWFVCLPVLCNLQIGIIDLFVYVAILSKCPNLNIFKFLLKSRDISVCGKPHVNLKQMTIKSEDSNLLKYDSIINTCLSYVPNLERLSIHQVFFQVNIPYYLKTDWHASSIANYLPLLHRFDYYFKIWYLVGINTKLIYTFDEMKRNFKSVHNDRYQSKFHSNLTC